MPVVRGRKLDQLRHKNYDGSNDEWSAIVKHVLISKQGSGVSDTIKKNLDVSCTISGKDPKATLSVSFRTRVEDITQRLGNLELSQTQDTDNVDLFGWASQAIDRRDELENQMSKEREDASTSTSTITSLQKQLEELTKAKAEHEDELLQKFAALLNEKKLRLREMNRQMSTGKVDKKALERLEATLPPSSSATRQRGKKRAARETEQENQSEESDGFEAMDVDKPETEKKAADSEDERHTTDDETETESEDEVDKPVTSQTEAGSAGSSKTPQKQKEQQQSLPPPRNLPFTRQTKQAGKEAEAPSPDDEETASEDDEL